MLVVEDALFADPPQGLVATIGNYDGIHRGQRHVLDLVRSRARELGLLAAVVTFDPHPLTVLRPHQPVLRLTTRRQKVEQLENVGMDVVIFVHFTHEFSRMPARTFVRDFLHSRLKVREVYVGSRFVFGHRRGGDLSLLRQMGESFGFAAFAVDEVLEDGEPISSTRIRNALSHGESNAARRLLGRPYSVEGIIARGDQVGRELGFPTINLSVLNELLPSDGVYASRVLLRASGETFDAVTNIGTRPTRYAGTRRLLETHILDFDRDVYGEEAEIFFYDRLREERRFENMMALSEQIGRDADAARERLRTEEPLAVGTSRSVEI